MKPINKLKYAQDSLQQSQESQRLVQLRKLLGLNLKNQDKLRKIKEDISTRMHSLDQFISTYRLKSQYPPANRIITYIKFQRTTPVAYREQSKVLEQQEAIKNTSDDDFQFIRKLNQDKTKKKGQQIKFEQLPKNPQEINFTELSFSSSTYKSGIQVYKAWLDYNKNANPKLAKRPYIKEQEQLIVMKQKIYKENWEKVCQFIESRTFEQVYYQFHNRINPKIRTGRWGVRQTMMLIILLQHFGEKKWAYIAHKMVIKSQLQVRERFCNVVNPNLGKNIWSQEMEYRLLDVVKQYNYSWKDIAKDHDFGNKTDNCIWRKYRNLMIKRSNEQIIDFMKDCPKKDLVQKIIKYKQVIDSKKKKSKAEGSNMCNNQHLSTLDSRKQLIKHEYIEKDSERNDKIYRTF